MYRHTCAMSILIPFGLSLNVGGNSDNMAKWMVCPLAVSPSSVMANKFAVEGGVIVGTSLILTCFQDVCDPHTRT